MSNSADDAVAGGHGAYHIKIKDVATRLTLEGAITFFQSELKEDYCQFEEQTESEFLRKLGATIAQSTHSIAAANHETLIYQLFASADDTVDRLYAAMDNMAYICDRAMSLGWSSAARQRAADELRSTANSNWVEVRESATSLPYNPDEGLRLDQRRATRREVIPKFLALRKGLGELATICAEEMEQAAFTWQRI